MSFDEFCSVNNRKAKVYLLLSNQIMRAKNLHFWSYLLSLMALHSIEAYVYGSINPANKTSGFIAFSKNIYHKQFSINREYRLRETN